jgi:DNA-binding IclR family transcriptional regulator
MSETTVPSRGTRPIGPVHRAFQLLQLVVAADGPIGVRDLARRAGISRSTTSRMLGILAELGMVERTADGGTRPGAGLANLTRGVDDSPAVLRERLRPLAADLEREFGENAAVGIDDGSGFRYLVSSRVDTAVQVADPVGESFPFHLIAPGVVAMSAWPSARLQRYLDGDLPSATTQSVTNPDAIRARLERVRADGYAWTDQELDLEVNGLAVPITGADSTQIAVATLYGPAYRLNPIESPQLGRQLAHFVRERSTVLLGS